VVDVSYPIGCWVLGVVDVVVDVSVVPIISDQGM
jgi:hypothetical protein